MLISGRAEAQAGVGVLTGTVTDASTKKPLADVVVTATSPSLQGEQTVVTDSSGSYYIPNLPPGPYTVNLDKEGYKPFGRGGISISAESKIRVNIDLLPDTVKAEEIVVVGKAPTVDVGSASQGVKVDQDFTNRIALNGGSATRSFEDLATVAPGAHGDAYGVSINGTTSPENSYVLDGVSVNDPAFGINSTPLSQEFVKEVAVISGGYLPEYGRSTGGILDVVTQSGSNEFHGSAFFYITPGALEGARKEVHADGQTIKTKADLSSLRDFGATIGGPIVKDKLWFFAGVDIALSTFKLTRTLNRINIDPLTGDPVKVQDPDTGLKFDQADLIPGTERIYYSQGQTIQYMGKLTYLINQDNNVSLSVTGTPSSAGGNGYLPFPVGLTGNPNTIGGRLTAWANQVVVKYSSAFDNKHWLLDATLGWHHQYSATLPSDGSDVGSATGLAGQPEVIWRRHNATHDFHSITEFENVPGGACDPVQLIDPSTMMPNGQTRTPCPVSGYANGGSGFIDKQKLDRYQGKAVVTRLFQGLGHHVVKGGVDFAFMNFNHNKAYSGGLIYRESLSGNTWTDFRQYGILTGPDQPSVFTNYEAASHSTEVGGFIQDSWSIADKITLNAGFRYDTQVVFGADGKTGIALPNQWSPRVGLIYDFTQQGRSKIYANFARYYESVPLDMSDRSFPGEAQISSIHTRAGGCLPKASDPPDVSGCTDPATNGGRLPWSAFGFWGLNNPNQFWSPTGTDKVPVDPDIHPQSSDEIVVGGEYQIIEDGTLGLSYTKRYMNYVVEDMSRDEANSYFIGNPGYGIASDFPKAKRDYDAMTVYFTKAFSKQWLAQASYTLSYVRGNWAGLFRPETGQLDPNINSDFDLRSLLPNREGPLPGDRTHQFQLYGAKDFTLPNDLEITVGVTYRSHSGEPLSALGSHILYGGDEVFVLPRGGIGRLPWVHTIDPHLAFGIRLSKDAHLQLQMDVFNIFNFQAITSRDETFTGENVLPIQHADGSPATKADLAGCTVDASGKQQTGPCNLRNSDGSKFDFKSANPNFGNPTSYQAPRQFRFGAKVTF